MVLRGLSYFIQSGFLNANASGEMDLLEELIVITHSIQTFGSEFIFYEFMGFWKEKFLIET